jgi:ribonuclease Z
MEIVLLGTGCPICDPARLGPSNLVRHAGRSFLVDVGSGAAQRLVAAGTPGRAIDALLLTHLHTDHLVDFYQLVISAWHQGRDRPQRVLGPPGTKRFVELTMELWRPEREQRIAHELRPSTRAFEVEVTEIAPGEIWNDGEMRITAVAVNHLPVKHAFGFVFAAGGRRAVFSGDTARCAALTDAARGADVLVHECFIHGAMNPVAGVRSEATVRNVASYHTLSSEVGAIAREAEVGVLVLNHFVPLHFDRDALIAEVRRDWAGPLVIGEDLMRYDLDTRVLTHRDGAIALGVA